MSSERRRPAKVGVGLQRASSSIAGAYDMPMTKNDRRTAGRSLETAVPLVDAQLGLARGGGAPVAHLLRPDVDLDGDGTNDARVFGAEGPGGWDCSGLTK